MAVGGVFARADFPRLYAQRLPFLKKLIGADDWPEVEKTWMPLFRIETSNRLREEHLMHAGMGSFNSMEENEAVSYDNIVQGPKKTYTHTMYGLGFQIGYLSAKHDLDGIIKRHAPELGRSARMTIQTLAAAFWNGSFATYTTADGQYVVDTDHTYIRGGGTFSNEASTNPELGHSALEAVLVQFANQKDLMGNPQPLPYEKLLIPPDLEPVAFELLRTDRVTGSDNWNKSFIYNKLTPVVWPFLSDSAAWWVIAPKQYTQVYWYWNIKPETTHGYDFDTEAAKTKTLFACSFGATDPRGIVGSDGGGS